jgi:uncharacterized protein (TIGR03435 family)
MVGQSGLLVALACVCSAQTPVKFEVASVRPDPADKAPYSPIAAMGEIKGGPGTSDPTRMSFTWVAPLRLLMSAFDLPSEQIFGNDWVMQGDARFDISATLPEGATKEQADEMLLHLLEGRFHLTYHHEKRDFDVFALVVAKGGAKLKNAEIPDGPPPEARTPGTLLQLDRDGFPIVPAGRPGSRVKGQSGVTHMTFRMATPQMLLTNLQGQLRPARLVDKTGLTGPYDFRLVYSWAGLPGIWGRSAPPAGAEGPEHAPDLFTALQKQLGLRMEKSKTPVDVVVIDHMDKAPTEN